MNVSRGPVSQRALLRLWTRPVHSMTGARTTAGFRVLVISAPAVAPDTARALVPDDIAGRRRFLCSPPAIQLRNGRRAARAAAYVAAGPVTGA